MKPTRVIGIILLSAIVIWQVARISSRNETRRVVRQFNEGCSLIEGQRSMIFIYRPNDKDSVEWMATHTRILNRTVDSCIKYYQDIYMQDEKRYKGYLGILFQYKKLVYLYQGWVKYCRDNSNLEKKKQEYPYKLRDFQAGERDIIFEKEHKAIEMILKY